MPQNLLESRIQDWVYTKTKTQIHFNADQCIQVLTDFGILSEDYDRNLHVLPLDGAARNLPLTMQTMSMRKEEYDIVEGYDKDIMQETDEEYKHQENKRKLFGWF
jgi:hypothetical protein